MGLESALLAKSGFTGPTTVLEGAHGFLQAFSPTPKPEALLSGLGDDWVCNDLTIKAYPCHVTGQAIAHAIVNHLRGDSMDADEIKSVKIGATARLASPRHGDRSPQTVLGGQYSLPFTVAVALTRDMSDPLAYDESAIHDRRIRRIAECVEIENDPTVGKEGMPSARIVLETNHGTSTIDSYGFPGSADEPLDYNGVIEKFQRYTRSMLSSDRADEIVKRVEALDQIDDVADLAKLIAIN